MRTLAPMTAVITPTGNSEGWMITRAMISALNIKTAPNMALCGMRNL